MLRGCTHLDVEANVLGHAREDLRQRRQLVVHRRPPVRRRLLLRTPLVVDPVEATLELRRAGLCLQGTLPAAHRVNVNFSGLAWTQGLELIASGPDA